MGVTYNIISLFMKKGLSCQQAYDAAGERLRALHREWYLAMADLPLWGEEVDAQAQEYVRGCQLLILANVNWRQVPPSNFVLFGPTADEQV